MDLELVTLGVASAALLLASGAWFNTILITRSQGRMTRLWADSRAAHPAAPAPPEHRPQGPLGGGRRINGAAPQGREQHRA